MFFFYSSIFFCFFQFNSHVLELLSSLVGVYFKDLSFEPPRLGLNFFFSNKIIELFLLETVFFFFYNPSLSFLVYLVSLLQASYFLYRTKYSRWININNLRCINVFLKRTNLCTSGQVFLPQFWSSLLSFRPCSDGSKKCLVCLSF